MISRRSNRFSFSRTASPRSCSQGRSGKRCWRRGASPGRKGPGAPGVREQREGPVRSGVPRELQAPRSCGSAPGRHRCCRGVDPSCHDVLSGPFAATVSGPQDEEHRRQAAGFGASRGHPGTAGRLCWQRSEIDPGQRLDIDPPWRVYVHFSGVGAVVVFAPFSVLVFASSCLPPRGEAPGPTASHVRLLVR